MKTYDVIVLCDTVGPPPDDQNFQKLLKTKDWITERNCCDALRKLGHEVRIVGLYDSIQPLLDAVNERRPDIVFNLVENFCGQSFYERNIVGLLELLQIPYTGSNPAAMVLCKNKAITKEILAYHKIRVPKFRVYYRQQRLSRPGWLRFPVIIKPLREEASVGISNASVVYTDDEFKERLDYIHTTMTQDAIVEEYIEGRELYIGVMGNKQLNSFPIRELFLPDDAKGPQIATYRVKWDQTYRKKWKVRYGFANFKSDNALEQKIHRYAKRIYRVLRIQGYARIDLRLTREKELYIIEANPNPGITRSEDFSLSARKAGLSYEEMIQKIVNLGLEYQKFESRQE